MSRTVTQLRLPRPDRSLAQFEMGPGCSFQRPGRRLESRIALAAAHIVADPLAENVPGGPAHVDWEATLAYRRHLWSWGLGVAEAMDTAQRGTGLDWPAAADLIRRSVREASAERGLVVAGAGTDQLEPRSAGNLDEVVRAYLEQCEVVEAAGGRIVLMASRELARIARSPDDYAHVYSRVLEQVSRPVIIHWLGEMFDPALAGYWGSADLDAAATTCLQVLSENRSKVDGIKVSLLDAAREVEMRRGLPPGVRMYTGDDFNFPSLIEGDPHGHSEALLGVFDAIAPAASHALQALDRGDVDTYREVLDPAVAFARHAFGAPTQHYKTGIVFLAYLNGHQDHFRMIGGQESMRSPVHLAGLFALADRARLFVDPELAAERMRSYLRLAGVE
jgi:hypothetical protein